VREIAADGQVTVVGLYHHFQSKQNLLREIMVEALEDVLHRTRTVVAGAGDDPREQLRALMIAWVLFHTRRQPEALIGSSELRSLEPEPRLQVVALRDEQEALFRRVIEDGRATGVFTTPYPTDGARAIIAMGYTNATWFRSSGPLTADELAERYAVMALQLVGVPTDDARPARPATRRRPTRAKKSGR
jgi:AcrR family transcriptional regulator